MKKLSKRIGIFTLALLLVLVNLPVSSMSFGEVEEVYSTVDIELKNSQRTYAIKATYWVLENGVPIEVSLQTSSSSGETISPLDGYDVKIEIIEHPDNNNPFPGTIKYHTTQVSKDYETKSPFAFKAGDVIDIDGDDEDDGYIDYITSWKEEEVFTVTFDSVGGTHVPAQFVEKNKKATDPGESSREYYSFNYWYLDDENEAYQFNRKVTSNITLTANWSYIPFTVSFYGYGSDNPFFVDDDVEYGTASNQPDLIDVPEKPNYHFVGWDASYDYVISNLDINALYEIDTYIVTFYDGLVVLKVENDVAYGSGATAPSPVPNHESEGKRFIGWDKEFDNITSNLNVYAVYEDITYTVTFMDGNDVFEIQSDIPHGGSAVAPTPSPNHVNEGKSFEGWSPAYTNVTGDLIVYAQYDDIYYTVNFYDGFGLFDTQSNIAFGGSADAPDPSPDHNDVGLDFTGWDKSFDYITSNLNVYAEYDGITYVVTFYDGDQVYEVQQNIPFNGSATAPVPSPDHVGEGFSFTGWSPDYSVITSNLNVYAQYDDITYTVTFYDGTDVVKVESDIEFGGSATAPTENPDHEAEGWSFTGWSPNFDVVTGNLSVYAQFEAIYYEVTFMDGDEVFDIQNEIPYGGSAIAPVPSPDHEADGSKFIGWDPSYMNITSDTIVYAQYDDIYYDVSFFGYGSDEPFYVDNEVLHGTSATAPTTIPAPPGKHFVGWDTTFVNVTSDLNVNALYETNVYTVTFVVPEGAPEAPAAQSGILHDSYASEPVYGSNWEGHTFEGWILGQSITPFDFENTPILGNIILVAKWTGVPLYTVTFYDGQEVYQSNTVYSGESVDAPEVPTKKGFIFEGWSGEYVFGTPLDDNYDMYAQWRLDPKVIITEDPESDVESEGVILRIGYNRTAEEGQEQLYRVLIPYLEESYSTAWSIVSGSNYIDLDSNGLVVGEEAGNAVVRVTVTYGEQYTIDDDVSVQVIRYYPPTPRATPRIVLDREEVELEYGTEALEEFFSYDFTETIYNSNDSRVTWSIEDEEIATVDENGVVTAVSAGETVVTVRHTASGATDSAIVFVFLVGDEETPLGALEFYNPYVYGYPDITFGPERAVTRAEVATMFAKILSLNLDFPGNAKFSDVDSDEWYYIYVQAIARTNIFVGDGDGKFRPNDAMSRAELSTVFAKYWEFLSIDVDETPVNIPDVDSSMWYSKYVYRMYNAGIVAGYDDGTYKPNNPTLRSHVVGMINSLIARPEYKPAFTKYVDINPTHWAYGQIEAASTFFNAITELPIEGEVEE